MLARHMTLTGAMGAMSGMIAAIMFGTNATTSTTACNEETVALSGQFDSFFSNPGIIKIDNLLLLYYYYTKTVVD